MPKFISDPVINFRMYSNVQASAQPGTRVIVIGGQDHTAVMRDLLGIDGEQVGVEVGTFFGAANQ